MALDEERLEAAARRSAEEKVEQKDKWHGGAQKGSLWLCYAGSLAERQKSGMSGNWQRQKLTPW